MASVALRKSPGPCRRMALQALEQRIYTSISIRTSGPVFYVQVHVYAPVIIPVVGKGAPLNPLSDGLFFNSQPGRRLRHCNPVHLLVHAHVYPLLASTLLICTCGHFAIAYVDMYTVRSATRNILRVARSPAPYQLEAPTQDSTSTSGSIEAVSELGVEHK